MAYEGGAEGGGKRRRTGKDQAEQTEEREMPALQLEQMGVAGHELGEGLEQGRESEKRKVNLLHEDGFERKRVQPSSTRTFDERSKRSRNAGGSSRQVVNSDSLKPGRIYDLKNEAKSLGLQEISQGRYVLSASKRHVFEASALATRQIVWESVDQVCKEDVKEIIDVMVQLGQAIHVNTGTHGDEDGLLVTTMANTTTEPMEFFLEDYGAIKALQKDSQVSIHPVSLQSRPYAPRNANVIINAWCWSKRYRFAEKMDPETGEVPRETNAAYLYNSLPKYMRRVIEETVKDQNLEDVEEGYMETDCMDRDPDLVSSCFKIPSSKAVEDFLGDPTKQVLLIQGKAGAGKSTLCKRWAIKLGDEWEEGQPYPVYLHLPAGCTSVRQYLKDATRTQEMDEEEFRRFARTRSFLVVLDGYDELGRRDKVVQQVYEELAGRRDFKAIITCRSDYLRSDGASESLFCLDQVGGRDGLETVWLCPMRLSDKDRVSQYVRYHASRSTRWGGWSERQYEEALETMAELREVVTTPFCLKVALIVLPSLDRKRRRDAQYRITRHEIYREYVKERMRQEWRKLKPAGQRKPTLAEEMREAEMGEESNMEMYMDAGKTVSMRMHRDNTTRIELRQGEHLWAGSDLRVRTGGGELQEWLLRGCLTRQKRLRRGRKEWLEISFEHDTLRSFFLAETTLDWLEGPDRGRPDLPESLSVRSLSEDAETIREQAAVVQGQARYKERLLQVIRASSAQAEDEWGRAAANAASILVAAGVSLSGEDLRGARLRGAVLRNGIFHRTRLEGADLSEANLSHAYLVEAKLEGAKLEGAYFGEKYYPRICAHVYMSCGSFSDDGKTFASGYDDGPVRVWDVETGTCRQVLEEDVSALRSVSMSGDGKTVGSGSTDGTVRVWDVETGKCRQLIAGCQEEMTCMSLSGDGRTFVSGSEDRMVRVWDVETGMCRQVLEGHNKGVSCVSMSGDGKTVASGSEDKTVRVWDVETGKCLQVLKSHEGSAVKCVSISGAGKTVASRSEEGTIRVWNINAGECLEVILDPAPLDVALAIVLTGRARLCVVAAFSNGMIRSLDVNTGQRLQMISSIEEPLLRLSLSGDGKTVASGSDKQTVRVWDVETGACRQVLKGNTLAVTTIGIAADGKTVASGLCDKTVRVWDVETGNCLHVFRGHDWMVTSVSIGGDGKTIASGSEEGTVRVWDIKTGRCLHVLSEHRQRVRCLSVGDGEMLASGSDDSTVRVWELETGRCRRVFEVDESSVMCVSMGGGGKGVAAGLSDMTVRVWEVETGTCRQIPNVYNSPVMGVSLSRDGKRVVSGSRNGTVCVWEVETGEGREVLQGNEVAVRSLSLSGQGQSLAVAGYDGSFKVWSASEDGSCWLFRYHHNALTERYLQCQGADMKDVSLAEDVKRMLMMNGAVLTEPSQQSWSHRLFSSPWQLFTSLLRHRKGQKM